MLPTQICHFQPYETLKLAWNCCSNLFLKSPVQSSEKLLVWLLSLTFSKHIRFWNSWCSKVAKSQLDATMPSSVSVINYNFSLLAVMIIIVRVEIWKTELKNQERGNQDHCSAMCVELSSTTGNVICFFTKK